MKLTKREVTLLFLLAIVALVYFGVTYLIMPQYQTYMDKQGQLDTLNGQLDTLNSNTTGTLDTQISQAKAKSEELSKPFAQSIDAEQLEYWVGTLLKQNGLTKMSTTYSDLTPSYPDYSKETATTGGTQKTGTTLQNTVNAANGVQTPSPSASPSAAPSASAQPSASGAANAQNAALQSLNASPSSPAAEKPGLNCEQLTLTASGSYDGIAKFMDALYASGRTFTVESFAIVNDTTGNKTLSLTVQFYSVPLISGSAQAYSFPSPAGQNALMNAAPVATPTPVASPSASASASAKP
jgi:hypothetical protein